MKEFIKNDLRSFVRRQRIRAGLKSDSILLGYRIDTLESDAEKIPCCDLFKILTAISSEEELSSWYVNLQISILRLRQSTFTIDPF